MTWPMTQSYCQLGHKNRKLSLHVLGSHRRTQTVAAMSWKRKEGCLQHCFLFYDQASYFRPLFIKCYMVQVFLSHLILILSWCLADQIIMRIAYTVTHFLLSLHPNHQLCYSQDCEKHPLFHTGPKRVKIVLDVALVVWDWCRLSSL